MVLTNLHAEAREPVGMNFVAKTGCSRKASFVLLLNARNDTSNSRP